MPLLLLEDMDQALRRTPAPVVFIGNPGKELSTAAANLTLNQKLDIMEQRIGKRIIDAVVAGPHEDVSDVKDRVIIQEQLEARDILYRHDRHLLHVALEKAIQALG